MDHHKFFYLLVLTQKNWDCSNKDSLNLNVRCIQYTANYLVRSLPDDSVLICVI